MGKTKINNKGVTVGKLKVKNSYVYIINLLKMAMILMGMVRKNIDVQLQHHLVNAVIIKENIQERKKDVIIMIESKIKV